ncbi:MAG: S8 family serine peptidase [Caldilineaceae bacterium]|nr:S8 family serine peptidase [Caldilineaceae bacterium]
MSNNLRQLYTSNVRLRRLARRRFAWQFGLALTALSILLLLVASPLAADEGDVTIEGVVTAVPGTADGLGRYTVDDGAQTYAVDADGNTEFDAGLPVADATVRVDGQLRGDGSILATRIRVQDESTSTPEPSETPEPTETPTATPGDGSDDHGGETYVDPCLDVNRDRWNGVVVSRPDGDGLGTWIIQLDSETQLTVVVGAQTTLDYGVPAANQWVEVRGRLRDAQSCTVDADRLRPDEFRGGEIVVRLASTDVVSQTVAAEYGMQATSTLLRSGSIYLFTVVDDDGLGEDDHEQQIIDQMVADARIEWAEFNYVNSVPVGEGYKTWGWGGVDPLGYQTQSAVRQVNLDAAHSAYNGAGVTVAVLDTGLDLQHPALLGKLLPGRDMVDDDDVPQDEGFGIAWGHGTHVGGIVAVAAPDAAILPVRVLDSNGRGNMFTLAYAIEWAVAQGADVINLSVGAESDSRVLRDTIAEAVAQGVVVVAAAGNLNSAAVQYPAGYPDVLSVTAVDGANVKASFASYGAGWVDIAAPGVGITSTIVGPQGSGYASWSGTSMSAPFVAGAAALVRQAEPTAAPAQIASRLTAAAADIDALNPAHAGQLGGLLDAAAALDVTRPEDPGADLRRVFLPTIRLQ